jgi:hypothetical protein
VATPRGYQGERAGSHGGHPVPDVFPMRLPRGALDKDAERVLTGREERQGADDAEQANSACAGSAGIEAVERQRRSHVDPLPTRVPAIIPPQRPAKRAAGCRSDCMRAVCGTDALSPAI